MESISGVYQVDANDERFSTRPRGLFRKKKFSPAVGDIVEFEVQNINEGYIHQVFERENELKRPPVSNIDTLVTAMSAIEPNSSTQLLDRFLAIAYSYQLSTRVLVTKKDKTPTEKQFEVNELLKIHENIGYETGFTGNDDDRKKIVEAQPAGLIVLSSQLGVGKPTFLNHYCPELNLETNDILKSLDRGKHITRRVELFERQNSHITDTLGFNALDFDHVDKDEIKDYFLELNRYGGTCKFRNCNHIKEPNYSVKHQLEIENIAQFRYDHHLQLFSRISNRKVRY